jgi:hypothetical protein
MSDNLKTKTACVVCSPLFISLAERFARDFGKVYLHVPYSGSFPSMNQGLVGTGIPGVTKVDSIFGPHFREVDLWIFPDIGHAALQIYLEGIGKRVWGPRNGEELEQYREVCKKLMEQEGLPVAPWKIVTGMTALRAHLKSHKDQHVKINKWRGLTETWFAQNVEAVSAKLDDLQNDLGAFKETCEFIVEDDLPDKVEVGTDVYCIDGNYPTSTLIGIEVKDLGYCAEFVRWDSIPEPLRRWNDVMAPHLARYGYRGFLSCEIRVGEDHVPYQIDACCRAGSPPSELYQEFYLNISEIIWEGSGGVLVDPEPAAKFGAQVVLKSSWANGHTQPVKFPEKFARNIKLFDYVIVGGEKFVLPLDKDVTEIGAVVGWGDTMDEAFAMVKEAGESIEGYGIKFSMGPVEKAVEDMNKLAEIGLPVFSLDKEQKPS